jgi:hypothetical protein
MIFNKISPPVITMGGLCLFEKSTGVSAPAFIEQLVSVGSHDPDAPLASDLVGTLISLIYFCCKDRVLSRKRVANLLRKRPDLIAQSLQDFLEDPLPSKSGEGKAVEGGPVDLPSALDMRAAWLAGGGTLSVFDGLKLWEHSRALKERQKRQKSALVDAAVAARMAHAKDTDFRKFVSGLLHGGRAKSPRELAQHLFNATAHMPKITQQQLAQMKGQA